MDERGAEITVEVIKAAGPTAGLAAVAPEIERRCAAEYVLPPSRPTIWNRIRAFRLEADTTVVGPPRILIGRMWFHLPVRGSPVDVMPALLAAVMLPERRIITYRSSIDPARPPSVDDLVCSLAARRTPGAAGRTLIIDPHDRVAASPALDASGLHGVRACRQSVQSQVSRVFGGRLGPLHVVHRRGKARPGKRPMLRQDEALPEDEVLRLIDEGVEAHNAATPVPPPFDITV